MGNSLSCGVLGFSHGVLRLCTHAIKWEVFSFLLIVNMLFVSKTFLAAKGFCENILSSWIDCVRNDSDLTNLHVSVDFEIQVDKNY